MTGTGKPVWPMSSAYGDMEFTNRASSSFRYIEATIRRQQYQLSRLFLIVWIVLHHRRPEVLLDHAGIGSRETCVCGEVWPLEFLLERLRAGTN